MNRTILVAALLLVAPAAAAQTPPLTKRAVTPQGVPWKIQATALTARATTGFVEKTFWVAYGGQVFVSFKVKSNGTDTVNWQAWFGDKSFASCSGSTSSATYSNFGCGSDVPAGSTVRVQLIASGQATGTICCAKLLFNLQNVDTPALATKD